MQYHSFFSIGFYSFMALIVHKKSFSRENLCRYNWVRTYVHSFMSVDPTLVISDRDMSKHALESNRTGFYSQLCLGPIHVTLDR